MEAALNWCLEHWSIFAFLLGVFIEITPAIKINPITALFRWLGKIIVADVMQEVQAIKEKLEEHQKENLEDEADRIRFEVLEFANSCRNGRKHTKSEFEHIIKLNTKYEDLMKKLNDENGVFTADSSYIYGVYQYCLKENKFLA